MPAVPERVPAGAWAGHPALLRELAEAMLARLTQLQAVLRSEGEKMAQLVGPRSGWTRYMQRRAKGVTGVGGRERGRGPTIHGRSRAHGSGGDGDGDGWRGGALAQLGGAARARIAGGAGASSSALARSGLST